MRLPKGYLSHSQITLWEKSPDRYRNQYYAGGESFSTMETRFGSYIHKLIETNDPSVSHIPRYDQQEKCVKVSIEGVPILAYIDTYNSETGAFMDYKTGRLHKSGRLPWDEVKVRKHDQLPFYATLIDELLWPEERQVIQSGIFWIGTEKTKESVQQTGNLTLGKKPEIRLTGKVKYFPRMIGLYERERQRKRIVRVAHEISEDYEKY